MVFELSFVLGQSLSICVWRAAAWVADSIFQHLSFRPKKFDCDVLSLVTWFVYSKKKIFISKIRHVENIFYRAIDCSQNNSDRKNGGVSQIV